MKTTITMTALLVGVLAIAMTADKVQFDWKPVKGSSAEYTTTNSHEADMGGGPVDLIITWDSTTTVEKVDGKKVWLDVENSEPDVEIDGSPANHVQVQVPDETVQFGLDCKYFPDSDEGHGPRLGIYAGFLLPKASLGAGDTYEIGGLKAKYIGTEKFKKWIAHKFTFEHRTGKGDGDLWSEGTIWLSTKDLSLVKRTAMLHNIDYGMGPEDVKNEIVRTK